MKPEIVPLENAPLLTELRGLITQARERLAVGVNRELVLLYWDLGQRVHVEILGEERAEYGERIVATVSAQLENEFGNGFSNLELLKKRESRWRLLQKKNESKNY